MLAVFCIRRAGEAPPPPGLSSYAKEGVRLVEEGPLGIWVAEGPIGPASVEAIRAHDAVVRRALRSATPLPTRYGTSFASEDEARSSLREREVELVATLERVAGRVEMGVRVCWEVDAPATTPPTQPRSGRDYLLSRRGELEERSKLRTSAGELLDRVESTLPPDAYPSVRTLLPEPHVAGLLAHLVHRDKVRVYRSLLEPGQRELPGVTLQLSGPWAPYSFV